MKKFIQISILVLLAQFSFGQSVTISPTQTTNSSNSSVDNVVVKSNQNTAGFYGYRHNGTLAAPTAVTSGQDLFKYSAGGYWGGGFDSGASLRFTATENWAGVSGTKASIWTTLNGTGGAQLERMTINHDGKVGIGIASPLTNLHLHEPSTSFNKLLLTNTTTGTTSTDGLEISNGGVLNSASIINYEGGFLSLGSNGSSVLYLSNAQKVGIGTFVPNGKLDILHNTTNLNTNPHLNLRTSDNTSNGIIRMENSNGTRFFGQYFSVGSATPASNFLSFDYNGTQPILDLAGNGNVQVAGFTKLGGASAPSIKMIKLTGTTNAAQGGNVSIAHGIADPTKIIGIQVLVRYNASGWVGNGYTGLTGYEFSYQYDGANIFIVNTSGNSANILTKDIKILVTYEE